MLQWPGELSQRIVNLTMIVLQRQVCRLTFFGLVHTIPSDA